MKQLLFSVLLLSATPVFAQQSDTTLPAATSLKAVVVSSKKPLIEQQIDKTVINVQNDISAAGSTAFDLLQKAPGIRIQADDVIQMSGKAGVNVMIDGRPTQMSAKDLALFLRGLPGSSIDKIEIISNPSARFDAQGNAGIINIRLRKNKIKGTNGSVGIGYTQNVHYRSNASANINHRSGKLNAFANLSVNNNLQYTNGYINRVINENGKTQFFNNTTIDQDRNTAFNIRTGADYYLNKMSSFGVLFTSDGNHNPFRTPGQTLISSGSGVDSILNTQNNNLFNNRRYNGNLNYHFEDSLGYEWNIDADATWFGNSNATDIATNYLSNFSSAVRSNLQQLDVATDIRILAFKVDRVQPFKLLNGKIESGFKFSDVSTSNNLDASWKSNGWMQADTGRSNLFHYHEQVAAGYLSFKGSYKKWEYQLGLRAEFSAVNGESVDLRKIQLNNPDTSYLNLFPSAFVAYALNDKHQLALSFSRRINRPDYQSLNPFEFIYDAYTYEKGNPYLRPQYSQLIELKYSYKYALQLALGYQHTGDYSQSISIQEGQITSATTSNIGTLDNLYFNLGTPIPINKWWSGYANITGFFNHYKGQLPAGKLDQQSLGWNFYVQQDVQLKKGWSAQLSCWFNAATTEAIYAMGAIASVDVAVKKEIVKQKGSIRLMVNDLFNTQRYLQTVQFGNMQFEYQRKWESRGIRIQFNWKFGKTSYSARERETNADGDRIKIKNSQ